MKYFTTIILLISGALSSGCSMKQAMNAEEFRQMAPQSMFGKIETFEVKQPIRKIASNFKKKAKECLNISLERTSCFSNGYGQSCSTTMMHYNPRVLSNNKRVELHVQMDIEGAVTFSEVPKGGMYMLVADAQYIGKNKSRIDLYYGSYGSDLMVKAIKGWASGRTKGCPDLASN